MDMTASPAPTNRTLASNKTLTDQDEMGFKHLKLLKFAQEKGRMQNKRMTEVRMAEGAGGKKRNTAVPALGMKPILGQEGNKNDLHMC